MDLLGRSPGIEVEGDRSFAAQGSKEVVLSTSDCAFGMMLSELL